MTSIDTAERRRRLAMRHHLAPDARAASLEEVACDLVGIHATDPASVYLGILARLRSLTLHDVAEALYEQRSVLKVLAMRRTMFVESRELVPIVQAAVTDTLAKKVPGLRVQITFGEGKKWAGRVGVSTRMLFLLATEGRIVRGRPRGTWLSCMYAW